MEIQKIKVEHIFRSVNVVIANKCERSEAQTGSFFLDHYECGLFTIQIHPADHLCDGLEKIRSIQFSEAARNEQFNFVLKIAYRRPSIRRVAGMRETASALGPVVEVPKMKGIRKV